MHELPPWRGFCDGYSIDNGVCRKNGASLRLEGGSSATFNGKFSYYNRQGAAQLINLDQKIPATVTLRVSSRCDNIDRSDEVSLSDPKRRDEHYSAREGYLYCAHLYLDCQDGSELLVESIPFSPGTHDWEELSLAITPSAPAMTAFVLLELQQPGGTAWFSDVSVTQADRLDENLLVFPNYKDEDGVLEKAMGKKGEYDAMAKTVIGEIRRAETDPTVANLDYVLLAVERVGEWLRSSELNEFWGYEWRDYVDARRKLRLYSRILSAAN